MDWLSTISNRFYGTLFFWPKIYEYNKNVIGPDPDLVPVGQYIRMPPELNSKLKTTAGLEEEIFVGPMATQAGPAPDTSIKIDFDPIEITARAVAPKKAGPGMIAMIVIGVVGFLMFLGKKK